LNTRFRTEDMAYVLGQSEAVAVILGERSGPVDYLAMLREAVPALGGGRDARAPALRHVIVLSDRDHADTLDWDNVEQQCEYMTLEGCGEPRGTGLSWKSLFLWPGNRGADTERRESGEADGDDTVQEIGCGTQRRGQRRPP